MEQIEVQRILEALLFVFSEPFPVKRLKEILPEAGEPEIRRAVDALNASYAANSHVVTIQEVAGSLQLVTDQAMAPWIRKALQPPRPDAVTAATMETLAIIAYRQPITKAEIEAIRGVDVTASLEALVERRLVRVAGRKDNPGRPFLYGTTTEFLRHFGLKSLQALPRMAPSSISEPVAEAPGPSVATEPAGAMTSVGAETSAAVDAMERPAPVEPPPAIEQTNGSS